jgi:hypothetical protein
MRETQRYLSHLKRFRQDIQHILTVMWLLLVRNGFSH